MSFTNGVRRQSEWSASEAPSPAFISNGITNFYNAERENGIPNVMTSPALITEYHQDTSGQAKTNGCACSVSKNGAQQRFEDDSLSAKSGSSSNELPTPPDGGWGWVVVFASFMIHIIGQ